MFTWRRLFSLRNRALLLAGLPLLSFLSLFSPMFSSTASAVTADEMTRKAEAWLGISAILEHPEDVEAEISASDANSCNYEEGDNSFEGPRLNSSNLASIGMTCAGLLTAIGYSAPSGSQSTYKRPGNFVTDTVLNNLEKSGFSSASLFFGGNLRTGVPSDSIAYTIANNLLKKSCSVSYRTELLNPIPGYNQDASNNQRVDWMRQGGGNTPLNTDEADTAENYHFWMWTYEKGKVAKNVYFGGSSMDDYVDVGFGARFLTDYQTGPRDAEDPWQADCYQAGRLLQDNKKYADAYARVVKPGGDITPGTCLDKYEGQPQQLNACNEGFKRKDPAFCQQTYAEAILRDACLYGAQKATGGSDAKTPIDEPADGGESKVTCSIPGLGWIVCPVVTFLSLLTDAAYNLIISNLLEVQPLSTDTSSGIFNAWSTMRNFANVAFVIVFMIIIFSQISGAGITNYGVKKMLPKLIIAAILVNVSYWICAAAVDLSNILGSSSYNLLTSLQENVGIAPAEGGVFSGQNAWGNVAGAALIITAAGAAAFYVTLAALLPMLVVVLATIISVFLALILRQALIIILIVLAPLAFVAYLLPNTEGLFKKWRGFLQILLLMYPIIGALFGGSALASTVIMASSTETFVQIAGAGAAIIPLIAAPALISSFNKFANRFGLPNVGVKLGRTRKAAEGVRDDRRNIAKARRYERAAGKRGPIGRLARNVGPEGSRRQRVASWIAGSGVTAGNNRDLRRQNAERAAKEEAQSYVATRIRGEVEADKLAGGTGESAYAQSIAGPTGDVSKVIAAAISASNKEFIEAVNAEKATMSRTDASELLDIMRDGSQSEERRSAAAGQLMKVGSDKEIHSALDYLGTQPKDANNKFVDSAVSSIQQQVAADMGTRKPTSLGAKDVSDLNKGNYEGDFESKVRSRLAGGKLSAEGLAKTSADELDKILGYVQANGASLKSDPATAAALKALENDINNFRSNPQLQGRQPAHEIGDRLDTLHGLL